MSLEEESQQYADGLLDRLEKSGIKSTLEDPEEAFHSGAYWGAVQGYKRGVNRMLVDAINNLPEIFNQIAETGFDMTIDWRSRFQKLLLKNCFNIES